METGKEDRGTIMTPPDYIDPAGWSQLWEHIQEDRAMLISEVTQFARCNSREFIRLGATEADNDNSDNGNFVYNLKTGLWDREDVP
jgi:hypothetical protein